MLRRHIVRCCRVFPQIPTFPTLKSWAYTMASAQDQEVVQANKDAFDKVRLLAHIDFFWVHFSDDHRFLLGPVFRAHVTILCNFDIFHCMLRYCTFVCSVMFILEHMNEGDELYLTLFDLLSSVKTRWDCSIPAMYFSHHITMIKLRLCFNHVCLWVQKHTFVQLSTRFHFDVIKLKANTNRS